MPKKKHGTDFKALAGIGAISMVAAFFMLRETSKPLPGPSEPLLEIEPSQLANLTLDFGNGTKREFRGVVTPDMNALAALSYATEAANMRLSYVSTTNGLQVAAIDGKKAEKKMRWIFYVNGQKGEDPAAFQMKPGDEIEWRFE